MSFSADAVPFVTVRDYLRGSRAKTRSFVKLTLRTLYNASCLLDWSYGHALAKAGVSPTGFFVSGDSLYIRELEVSLWPENAFLINNLQDALLLRREAGFRFGSAGRDLLATTGELTLHVTSSEEIFILREIFRDKVYNFGVLAPDVVVWDVGMNVGFASLFFASLPCVTAVLGFEPFRPTYDLALRNLSLNPGLAAKIRPQNCGISDREFVAITDYVPEWKGSVGVAGIRQEVLDRDRLGCGPMRTERVLMRAADQVLAKIVNDFSGSCIIAKIDCEGAEYEIVRCLAHAGLLGKLSMVILEWHERGPFELERTLHEAGFATHSTAATADLGMIYAMNQKNV